MRFSDQKEWFWKRIAEGAPVFPGVMETLGRLAPSFRLGLATGADRRHFERVHASTGLRDFFKVVFSRDDYEEAKPSPQAYRKALESLTLEPYEYIAVEDSPRGMAASMAAGISCIVIPTPLTDIALCPAGCQVLENISKLPDLLEPRRFDT